METEDIEATEEEIAAAADQIPQNQGVEGYEDGR